MFGPLHGQFRDETKIGLSDQIRSTNTKISRKWFNRENHERYRLGLLTPERKKIICRKYLTFVWNEKQVFTVFVTLQGGTGGLRHEAPEDRQLTVDDMQGMFLLLGIGLVFAGVALLQECWVGYQCCDDSKSIRSQRSSIPSIVLTPCSDSGTENDTFVRRVSIMCQRAFSAAHQAGSARVGGALRRFSRWTQNCDIS